MLLVARHWTQGFHVICSFVLFSKVKIWLKNLHLKERWKRNASCCEALNPRFPPISRNVEVRFYVPATWPRSFRVNCCFFLLCVFIQVAPTRKSLIARFTLKKKCVIKWCFMFRQHVMCLFRFLSLLNPSLKELYSKERYMRVRCSNDSKVKVYSFMCQLRLVNLKFPSLQDLHWKERWKWDVLCSGSMAKAVQLLPLSCAE